MPGNNLQSGPRWVCGVSNNRYCRLHCDSRGRSCSFGSSFSKQTSQLLLVARNRPVMLCRAVLLIGLLSTVAGCTHTVLRNDTRRTTNTLADLEFQQIHDNVARFHCNPDTVPSFAVPNAGTVSVSDPSGGGNQSHLFAHPHASTPGQRSPADFVAALSLDRPTDGH